MSLRVRRRTTADEAHVGAWGRLAPVSIRPLLAGLCIAGSALGMSVVLPSLAAAEALPGPAPQAGSPGLPDGRLYEEVSPANKSGNFILSGQAGRALNQDDSFGAASADGNALVFVASGAMGHASSSMIQPLVARRVPGSAWLTESATPTALGLISVYGGPVGLLESSDFTRFAFMGARAYSREQPLTPEYSRSEFTISGDVNIFLSEDPFVEPAWLAKPTITSPIPALTENRNADWLLVGGSPTLNTVYFTYSGTLVAQDAPRAPHVGDGLGHQGPWGLYEWTAGKLESAGVLPDGTTSAGGALPAAMAGDDPFNRDFAGQTLQAADFNNEVSMDGSRLFFVSPDPAFNSGTPPELYVRETAPDGSKRSVLVSQSQLPGQVGDPAPTGAVAVGDPQVGNKEFEESKSYDNSYVYASKDGSRAFFLSSDRLTVAAPENSEAKEYEFDIDSKVLTYLPGVVGPIVAAAQDGSDFLFQNSVTGKLELWRQGAAGGQVTPVASVGQNLEARASADGSVFVFDTALSAPAGFNSGGYKQVYRYDAARNELICLSCSPAGVTPSGGASISYDNTGGVNSDPRPEKDSRVIAADGSRVFFDTPDPLVPQDTNGKRDVYEWEAGRVYLISSGSGGEDAFYVDNSESGSDVFFNTGAGLAPGDTDGSYDAYDARIPHPGDNPLPAAVPCQGDVCQGPPSVPQLLGLPPSATFNGVGNLSFEVTPAMKPKPKAAVKCVKGKRLTRGKCVRRKKSKKAKRASRDRRGS